MKIFLLIFLQIIFLNVCKCLEINKIQKSAIEIRKTTNGKNINNINIVAPVDNETDIIRKKRSSINRERLIKVRLEEEKNLESSTKGQELKRFDKKVDEGNKDGKINGRKVVIGEDNDKKLNEENGLEGLELHREGMMEEKVKEKKQLNIKENNEKDEDEDGYNEEKVKMNEVDVNRMDEEGEEDTQENIYENAKGKEIDKMNEVDEREENMEEKVGINKLNEEEEEEEEEENIKGKFKANGGNNANKLQNQQIVEENKINEEKMEMDEELFEINNENNEIKNKRWGRVEESYFSEELSDEVKDKEEIEKLKEIEKENKNEKKIGIEEKERQIFKFGDEFNNNNNYNKQQIDKKQFFGLKDNFGENNIQQKFNEYKQQPQQLTYNSYLNLFNPDEGFLIY
ncbi:unnamed protein product [Meloidogyne enterolobii]|uniref:Uncharacterized protein n=1 Tax=Meloidogyne enterolobii TaxID=390850 RepID=A0ACB0YR05_MELEN